MTRAQHEQQARQFIGWHSKRGDEWEGAFHVWAESKDLAPRDRLAIRIMVNEIRLSMTAVVTDPLAWLRGA